MQQNVRMPPKPVKWKFLPNMMLTLWVLRERKIVNSIETFCCLLKIRFRSLIIDASEEGETKSL